MNPDQWKQLHAGELAFFAKISASISHEIKNHLAIINEQNGLIGDLLHMAERGKPLSAERLAAVVRDVAKQVSKTDYIVRRFNTFAHTADSPVKSIDVPDFLNLLVELAARPARLKEMSAALAPCPEHVLIRTHPFEFLHVLYSCLNSLFNHAAPGDRVIISLVSEREQVRILMAVEGEAGEGHCPTPDALSEDGSLRLLLDRLQARLPADHEQSALALVFPVDLDPEAD